MEHISDCSEVEGLDVVSSMFEESLKITPYTQLANLTGQPAISLPTHLTKENMPLGIQFMAARGRDLLFQIGYLFEANHQFHYQIHGNSRNKEKKNEEKRLFALITSAFLF